MISDWAFKADQKRLAAAHARRERNCRAVDEAADLSPASRALMLAAIYGDPASVARFLPEADACARNALGDTALILSVRERQLGAVRALLPASDPNAKGEGGQTALMRASAFTGFLFLEALIPVSDANAQDDLGDTALIHAFRSVDENFLVCVNLLLRASDLSIANQAGETPLIHMAHCGGHNTWQMTEVLALALTQEEFAVQWPRVRQDRRKAFERNWQVRGIPLFAKIEAAALQAEVFSRAIGGSGASEGSTAEALPRRAPRAL